LSWCFSSACSGAVCAPGADRRAPRRQWSATGIWAPGAIQVHPPHLWAPWQLLAGFLLHLLAWIAGAFEAWWLLVSGKPLPWPR
jgi:hypothetical protein